MSRPSISRDRWPKPSGRRRGRPRFALAPRSSATDNPMPPTPAGHTQPRLMDIVHCTQGHSARWDDYAMQNETATFYHRFAWKDINEKCFGHRTFYLAAVDGNGFRGIFPIVFLKSRIFGKMLCSMPFVNLGGPCASDAEAMDGLLDEAGRILRGDAGGLSGNALAHQTGYVGPHVGAQGQHDDRACPATPRTIWKAFTSKHRNTIRSAQRKGFTTSVGGAEQLDQFYEVLSESWRSLGTPLYAKSYFREIAEQAGRLDFHLPGSASRQAGRCGVQRAAPADGRRHVGWNHRRLPAIGCQLRPLLGHDQALLRNGLHAVSPRPVDG